MSSQLSSLLTQTIGTFSISAILSAAVTLLICLVVVRVLLKLTRKLLAGSKLDQRVQKYILAGIRLLLYIVTALIVADCLHINMTSLVALLSVGSLGITLAAEDILGNVAGGLVILSSHPFAIGDFVEVSGTSGTVDEISLNHTKLVTPDGLMVMLPNKELASSRMTNYTVLGRRPGHPEDHRLLRRPHGDCQGRLPPGFGGNGKCFGGPCSQHLSHRIWLQLHRVYRLLLGHGGALLAGAF